MEIKLFDGEIFDRSYTKNGKFLEYEINKQYISGEIRIITEQGRYPLQVVAELFSNKIQFNDNTPYQRNYVWSIVQKSRLIESFIMNIPIPPIFLYEQSFNRYEILDGKQRISSVVSFYKNEFALEGLEIWNELNGLYYRELPESIKDSLNRRYLSSVIMLNESVKDKFAVSYLKRLVFERINTGGEHLTTQEARNAIFEGPFNTMVNELAADPVFRNIWGFNKEYESLLDIKEDADKDYRFVDSELVLRFFAFRHIDKFDANLNLFLDQFLAKANTYDKTTISSLKNLFLDTLYFAYELFDKHPFTFINNNKYGKKAVRTIYDPLMQVLSQFLDYKQIFINKRTLFLEKYIAVTSTQLFNGKLQEKNLIKKRIDAFENIALDLLIHE